MQKNDCQNCCFKRTQCIPAWSTDLPTEPGLYIVKNISEERETEFGYSIVQYLFDNNILYCESIDFKEVASELHEELQEHAENALLWLKIEEPEVTG